MKMPLKRVVVGTKNRKLDTVNKRQKHVGGSNQKEQERKQRHKQEERIEEKEQNMGADQGEQKEHKVGKHINSAQTNSHGQGLSIAPEKSPEPGDIWRWSTGERAPTRKKDSEELVTDEGDYVEEVPKFACCNKEADEVDDSSIKELAGDPMAVENKNVDDSIWCKIGNINCTLLNAYRRYRNLPKTKTCEMCCVESGFCGECCCLLCGKIIDQLSTDYTFIRCEQKIGEDFICGHVAHLECALGCATAGVLKKIQLDAEYYCRRCDEKTDLVMHVQLLIQRSMSLQESSKVQKNLQLALHIIRGTHREGRDLQVPLEMALNKIHSGVKLQDISELKDLTTIVHKMLGGSGKHFVYQPKASENVQGADVETSMTPNVCSEIPTMKTPMGTTVGVGPSSSNDPFTWIEMPSKMDFVLRIVDEVVDRIQQAHPEIGAKLKWDPSEATRIDSLPELPSEIEQVPRQIYDEVAKCVVQNAKSLWTCRRSIEKLWLRIQAREKEIARLSAERDDFKSRYEFASARLMGDRSWRTSEVTYTRYWNLLNRQVAMIRKLAEQKAQIDLLKLKCQDWKAFASKVRKWGQDEKNHKYHYKKSLKEISIEKCQLEMFVEGLGLRSSFDAFARHTVVEMESPKRVITTASGEISVGEFPLKHPTWSAVDKGKVLANVDLGLDGTDWASVPEEEILHRLEFGLRGSSSSHGSDGGHEGGPSGGETHDAGEFEGKAPPDPDV